MVTEAYQIEESNELWDHFAVHLASCWSGKFFHTYRISKHAAWKVWREKNNIGAADFWHCDNLEDACRNYSWVEENPVKTSEVLQSKLQVALRNGADDAVEALCYDIFDWGQVSRSLKTDSSGNYTEKCRAWVQSKAKTAELCDRIIDAVFLLQPNCLNDLADFKSSNLLMNSSMTKVYAFADPQQRIAIYDSRVGAALGLIARDFLEKHGYDQVPPQLSFMWGEAASGKLKTRDPSSSFYKFRKLPYGPNADLIRAKLSRDTNIILQMALNEIRKSSPLVTLEDIERSLFMVGFDVRR